MNIKTIVIELCIEILHFWTKNSYILFKIYAYF